MNEPSIHNFAVWRFRGTERINTGFLFTEQGLWTMKRVRHSQQSRTIWPVNPLTKSYRLHL